MTLLSLLPVLWFGGADALAWDTTPPCLSESTILNETRAAFPSRYDNLMKVRGQDPERFAQMLHSTAHVLDDPAMVAQMARVDEAADRFDRLAAALAKADPSHREALETQLLDAAEALTDAKIAVRQLRLTQLKQNARELEQEIRALEAERDASVDQLLERAFQ